MIDVLWADANVATLSIDYDSVVIELEEATGERKAISCLGYIGYQCIGFWDEAIVERANFLSGDTFVKACKSANEKRLGPSIEPSGNAHRNEGEASSLHIHFIDGGCLSIAASEFSVRKLI